VVAVIHRGEIWTANLNPTRGSEIGKIRPVLIMQADVLNDLGSPMVVILPMTTRVHPAFRHFRVTIAARERLLRECQVVVDQPRALDRNRIGTGPLTRLTRAEMKIVERSLLAILDIVEV
jgi:mRNA interferase MazF